MFFHLISSNLDYQMHSTKELATLSELTKMGSIIIEVLKFAALLYYIFKKIPFSFSSSSLTLAFKKRRYIGSRQNMQQHICFEILGPKVGSENKLFRLYCIFEDGCFV